MGLTGINGKCNCDKEESKLEIVFIIMCNKLLQEVFDTTSKLGW